MFRLVKLNQPRKYINKTPTKEESLIRVKLKNDYNKHKPPPPRTTKRKKSGVHFILVINRVFLLGSGGLRYFLSFLFCFLNVFVSK